MPTKLNKAGEQQEYVPAGNGDASGEYGNESGSNRHFQSFGKKQLSNFKKPLSIVESFRNETINNKKQKLLERGEKQYDDINLDLSKPIHKIDETDRLKYRTEKNAEGYDIAENLLKKYEANVDNIANDLKNATEKLGGVMIGLDFRLKRPDSLTRKLYSEVSEAREKGETITLQDAANKMGDIARFTSCFDPEHFKENADKVIRSLQADGYELVKFKNYFQPGASYKGLNCNFRDKNGNLFELQFHTPETMKIKEGYKIDLANRKAVIDKLAFQSHDVYETTRVLEDKIRNGEATDEDVVKLKALKNHNIEMWDSIKYSFPDWSKENYDIPKGNIVQYNAFMRDSNGGATKSKETYRARELSNGLAVETKAQPTEHHYAGNNGKYKVIDLETGSIVGYAKNYNDAYILSQDKEFINKINNAKKVFYSRYPQFKK